MREGLLFGALVLFVLFLRKGKPRAAMDSQARPIAQNWMGNKRLGLLPYVDAQANHESGDFGSRLALEQSNLFGMKVPRIRPFVGFPVSGSEFAGYSSFKKSVEDLFLWMDATGFPTSVSGSAQYVEELKKRGYFEDSISNYLKGVNRGLADLAAKGVQGFKISNF